MYDLAFAISPYWKIIKRELLIINNLQARQQRDETKRFQDNHRIMSHAFGRKHFHFINKGDNFHGGPQHQNFSGWQQKMKRYVLINMVVQRRLRQQTYYFTK